ncbi:MAG: hypothetical protein DRQ98_11910 [Gammaproteobacteria bacterium]|nr:MAG: hypothetical protein DRQ98_11910 [Gammaproteobacteria bacterium]
MHVPFPTKKEYLEFFNGFLTSRTQDMTDYVNRCMNDDGDTEETSQRICIINAINNLEAAIAGTEIEDLIISEKK